MFWDWIGLQTVWVRGGLVFEAMEASEAWILWLALVVSGVVLVHWLAADLCGALRPDWRVVELFGQFIRFGWISQ